MLLSLLLTSLLTLVELNCENLFDTRHDPSGQDQEFLPGGSRHWTSARYWHKVNAIGREVLSCSDRLPDLVALCEVENDSVMRDLTRRSLLRNAGYEYLMTASGDVRGLDVALLYQPATFRPLCYETIAVEPLRGMRPTRDILYVKGEVATGDTLHVFVVHLPSRYGGEKASRPYRRHVAERLLRQVASIGGGRIVVAGDFNDYADSPSVSLLRQCGLHNISARARGSHGAGGTYRYRGHWRSLDHVLVSGALLAGVDTCYVNDAPFLMEDEPKYGGSRPRRTYQGYRYQHGGYSDHLPLVARFRLSD